MEDLLNNKFISTKVFLNKYYYSTIKDESILIKYKKINKGSHKIINSFIKLINNYNKSKEEFYELQNILLKNYKFIDKNSNQNILESTVKTKVKEYLMSFFDKNCSFLKYRNCITNENTQNIVIKEIIFRITKIKKFLEIKNMEKYNIKIISIYHFNAFTFDEKVNYYIDIYHKINKMFELYDEYKYLMEKYKYEIEQLIKVDMFDLYIEDIDSIISDDEEEDICKDIINDIIKKLEN